MNTNKVALSKACQTLMKSLLSKLVLSLKKVTNLEEKEVKYSNNEAAVSVKVKVTNLEKAKSNSNEADVDAGAESKGTNLEEKAIEFRSIPFTQFSAA